MPNLNDSRNIAELLNCLSLIEEKVNDLYDDIAGKTEMPFVKSLFDQIAIDSHKHSIILKGISQSINETEPISKQCMEKFGSAWKTLTAAKEEIAKIQKIDDKNLPWLVKRLAHFESDMGEEYFIFIQMKTLHVLVKEINHRYNIDLNHAKSLFESIIHDEDHHRELLEIIRCLVNKKDKENDTSLVARYQSLDAYVEPCKVRA